MRAFSCSRRQLATRGLRPPRRWANGPAFQPYDPKVPRERAYFFCCDVVNRGVALHNGKIYVGTLDGRLIALDQRSGTPLWSIQTTDPAKAYSITAAPRIARDKVIIGNAGSEYGMRGYITAYNSETGHQVWRFYTAPGDPEKGFESKDLLQTSSTDLIA